MDLKRIEAALEVLPVLHVEPGKVSRHPFVCTEGRVLFAPCTGVRPGEAEAFCLVVNAGRDMVETIKRLRRE